jgi:hypothetical protein
LGEKDSNALATAKPSRKSGMETAEQQAQAQLESIVEMIVALRAASNDNEQEAAQIRIEEDPLSVEVRGDWHAPGGQGAKPSEFIILLCTGGPAVRIRGELDRCSEPENPRIEYQDWFTPWRQLLGVTDEENDALVDYCRQFYFGDA